MNQINTRKPFAQQRDWTTLRLKFVAGAFLLALVGLWARAFYVQIIQGAELAAMAKRQYWREEVRIGKRGEIFDRNGVMLAKSVQVQSVFARPKEVEDIQLTARTLAKILTMPEGLILQKLKEKRHFVWIARKIGDRNAVRLTTAHLPGVYQLEESERVYPQGHLAGQLLGFVGLDDNGLEGIENSYDSLLRGKEAHYVVQKDASGRLLYANLGNQPEDLVGKDIRLTIDSRIQFATEEALSASVQQFGAASGMSLVVDVKSGDILAMAHYPFFNPNAYKQYSSAIWRNRISQDVFEVGSTMKPFLIAAALQEKTCRPDTVYYCEKGKWVQKSYSIKDTKKHDSLPVSKILSYSSNIGAAKIGLGLGAAKYHGYLTKFGFGQPTNLNLTGEGKGLVRPYAKWATVDLANISFGQGIAVTGLQLTRGFLSLARQGKKADLHLLLDESQSAQEVQKAESEEKFQDAQIVSPRTAKEILKMLKAVVTEGTGKKAAIHGVEVGGKTGTAQKVDAGGGYGEKYISSFVGLIPAMDPKYVVMVIVDEPTNADFGGIVAAPAVRDVALQTLSYRGEFPEAQVPQAMLAAKSEAGNSTAVRFQAEIGTRPRALAQVMPDVRGLSMRQAFELLLRQGISPRIEGEGMTVVRQTPDPGALRPKDKDWDCTIWLTDKRGQS